MQHDAPGFLPVLQVLPAAAILLALAALEGPSTLMFAIPLALCALVTERRVLAGFTVFLATVLALAIIVKPLTGQRISVHLQRALAEFRLNIGASDTMQVGTCERYHYHPSVPVEGGGSRDALGRAILELEGPDRIRILLVGDSVMDRRMAAMIAAAFKATGRGLYLLDTSVPGYDWTDEACRVADAVEQSFDLAIVGVCLNDLPMGSGPRYDLGAGEQAYDLLSEIDADLHADLTPLLLSSNHPWILQRRPALEAKFGPAIAFDVKDPAPVAALLPDLQDGRAAKALGEVLRPLVDRRIPTVVLPFPLIYDAAPDPTDPLIDWVLQTSHELGALAVDVRPVLRDLSLTDRSYRSLPSPEDLESSWYDIVHYQRGALGLAGDAALAALTTQNEIDLTPERVALLDKIGSALPTGPRDCTPRPLQEGPHGLVAPPACESSR